MINNTRLRHMQAAAAVAAALALCLLLPGAAATTAEAAALATCLNAGAPEQQFTRFEDFSSKRPVRLRAHKTWASAKPQAVQLTIATGLNPSRLNQLEAQCRGWQGPLSAAVYVKLENFNATGPLPADEMAKVEAAAAELDTFHSRMEAIPDACQLDVALVYEVVGDDVAAVLFPVNTLRNVALLQARTDLVAMVDVDLLVSDSLYKWCKDSANYASMREGTLNKQIFVLPAFETAPRANETEAHALADSAARMSKPELAKLVKKKLVYQFAQYLFWQGHNSTDYKKWFSTDKTYAIRTRTEYEPWFVIDRMANPFYDSAFRGYGWNKVTHVANVLHQKYTFMAHPAGFLVHRQHSRSAADKMYQRQKKVYEADAKANRTDRPHNNLAGLTHKFRDQITAELEQGTYTPLLDDGIRGCLGVLPWWTGWQQQQQQQQQPEQQQQQQALAAEAGDGAFGTSGTSSRLSKDPRLPRRRWRVLAAEALEALRDTLRRRAR